MERAIAKCGACGAEFGYAEWRALPAGGSLITSRTRTEYRRCTCLEVAPWVWLNATFCRACDLHIPVGDGHWCSIAVRDLARALLRIETATVITCEGFPIDGARAISFVCVESGFCPDEYSASGPTPLDAEKALAAKLCDMARDRVADLLARIQGVETAGASETSCPATLPEELF